MIPRRHYFDRIYISEPGMLMEQGHRVGNSPFTILTNLAISEDKKNPVDIMLSNCLSMETLESIKIKRFALNLETKVRK